MTCSHWNGELDPCPACLHKDIGGLPDWLGGKIFPYTAIYWEEHFGSPMSVRIDKCREILDDWEETPKTLKSVDIYDPTCECNFSTGIWEWHDDRLCQAAAKLRQMRLITVSEGEGCAMAIESRRCPRSFAECDVAYPKYVFQVTVEVEAESQDEACLLVLNGKGRWDYKNLGILERDC